MSGPGLHRIPPRAGDQRTGACREPPCEEGREDRVYRPVLGMGQLPCRRVQKHPGTVQSLGTPRSLVQPQVLRPDPWGVLGVALSSHVLRTRAEPETVTELWTLPSAELR